MCHLITKMIFEISSALKLLLRKIWATLAAGVMV